MRRGCGRGGGGCCRALTLALVVSMAAAAVGEEGLYRHAIHELNCINHIFSYNKLTDIVSKVTTFCYHSVFLALNAVKGAMQEGVGKTSYMIDKLPA